jgi:hypothetical protein
MAYKRRPGAKEPEMGLLTEARKEELRIDAEAKVIAERTMAAEREYAAIALEEERAKFDPDLVMEEIVIDLPANSSRLLIDYKSLHHGQIVSVTAAVAASLRDQMARMWEQEKLAGNPNLRDYKPIRNYDLNAKTGETHGAPALMRV